MRSQTLIIDFSLDIWTPHHFAETRPEDKVKLQADDVGCGELISRAKAVNSDISRSRGLHQKLQSFNLRLKLKLK